MGAHSGRQEVASPMPGEAAGANLGRRAAQGLLWFLAQNLAARVSGLAAQVVLAWLLLPSDFGKVGLALTVSSLAGTLVNFGIDDILLQRQQRMHRWIDSAFWMSAALGSGSALAVLAVAPLGASAYGSPDLVGLLAWLAAALAIGSLATVPAALIRAGLDFRFLALFNSVEVVSIQALTVLLAWAGAGAYSFVVPVPLLALVKVVVFWRRARPAFGRPPRRRQVRAFGSRGLMVCGTRVLGEGVSQGGAIVLGLVATPDVVGLYVFAFRLAALPVRMLAGTFQNVLFPTLAQLNGDPARQVASAFKAGRLLAFVVMPLCFLQAAVADPALHLLFGSKWEGAIPLAQILSLGLPFDAVSWVAGALLSARGAFGFAFRYSCVSTLAFFAAVVLGGLVHPPVGVAVAIGLYYALLPVVVTALIFRSPEIRLPAVAALFAVPAVLATAAVGAAYLVSLSDLLVGRDTLRLVVITGIAGPLYLVLVRLAAPDIAADLTARIRALITARRLAALEQGAAA